ncbi:MAG: hypothetical protein ACI9E1_001995 [Cryomorphaceae bacterium]|jgi:hypothetical protein
MGSNWLERQKGVLSDREKITKWWKKASALGEKKYVEKYTLVSHKDGLRLSSELLMLATDRYPELIPKLYRKAISSKMHSWPIAKSLVFQPHISTEVKIDLLTKAIATEKDEHRNSALRGLIKLKSKKAHTILVKLIKNASKTTKTEYWKEQNTYLARMVSQTNNIELWNAIVAFIHRADLGMRMQLISRLRPNKDAPKEILSIFFNVYDTYKNDKTLRDEKSSPKYDGPGAGFPYDVISVRNFIHTHYASWLIIKIPRPDRKKNLEPQWKKYSSQIEEKLNNTEKKRKRTLRV